MSRATTLNIGVSVLATWPAVAGLLATKLGFAQRRAGGILFASAVAIVTASVGLIFDYSAVHAGDASAVGPWMILLTLALAPPAFAAAFTPRARTALASPKMRSTRQRIAIAYATLCASAPAGVILGGFFGLAVCQGGCL